MTFDNSIEMDACLADSCANLECSQPPPKFDVPQPCWYTGCVPTTPEPLESTIPPTKEPVEPGVNVWVIAVPTVCVVVVIILIVCFLIKKHGCCLINKCHCCCCNEICPSEPNKEGAKPKCNDRRDSNNTEMAGTKYDMFLHNSREPLVSEHVADGSGETDTPPTNDGVNKNGSIGTLVNGKSTAVQDHPKGTAQKSNPQATRDPKSTGQTSNPPATRDPIGTVQTSNPPATRDPMGTGQTSNPPATRDSKGTGQISNPTIRQYHVQNETEKPDIQKVVPTTEL